MQNKIQISIACCRLIALVAIFAGAAFAQTERAGMSGVVRDHQGKAIPGAVVEVRHETTKLVRRAVTGASGIYFIDGLPLGDYSMRINSPGFAETLSDNIRLFVGETRTVDVTLEISGREERVVITTNSS